MMKGMTERQKLGIMENCKDFFRRMIRCSDFCNIRYLHLNDLCTNPFELLVEDLSPESKAKALVYLKVFNICIHSLASEHIFFKNISRLSHKISINERCYLEFVDAIDGRKKYAYITSDAEMGREDMNHIFATYKEILKERSQKDPSFLMDDMVVGVLFGDPICLTAELRTLQTTYPVYCGKVFWEHITGDKLFYQRLIKVFYEVVEEDQTEKCELVRQKVKDIVQEIEKVNSGTLS